MARKVIALVASALLLLLVFVSYDACVDAWCLEYPAPNTNACREGGRGVQPCADRCRAAGQSFQGGACKDNGDCVCLKCADEPPAAAAAANAQ